MVVNYHQQWGRSATTRGDVGALRGATHEGRTVSLGANPRPPPHRVVSFSLLESFHSRGSNHPVEEARLTWRKASHSIITMASRSWI